MASLAPVITSSLISSGIGLFKNEMSRQSNRSSRNQALENLQEKQKMQMQQLEADNAMSRKKIGLEARNLEEARKKSLRRAVSRRRANFGSQGIGSGAGSSQAVLLGMFEESEAEKAKRQSLDDLRLNALGSDLSQQKSLNVLQRMQMEERNNLKAISGYGETFGDALSIGGNIASSILSK